MSEEGVYEERLPCGGRLKVNRLFWEIAYYFSGPDLRYRGTFFSVPGARVDEFIMAFEANWLQYRDLLGTIPADGEFVVKGKAGMSIRIGGYWPGGCLHQFYNCVASEQDVKRMIASYTYAKQRALQVQRLLEQL